jgi:HK97 family phage portal protein
MNFFQRAALGTAQAAQSTRDVALRASGESLKRLKRLPQKLAGSAWGLWNSVVSGLPYYDHSKRVGKLLNNSSLACTIKALTRMLTDAELCAQKRTPTSKGGKWEIAPDHPLAQLLAQPNPYFDSTLFLDAIAISYVLDGNAYVWKARNEYKQVIELWPISHTCIEPIRKDGTEFVDYYEYKIGRGEPLKIPPEDIIHIRDGVDPENNLKGWSAVKSATADICTENESQQFTNALLFNSAIPSVVITPKNDNIEDFDGDKYKRTWKDKFGGNRRGEAWIQDIPLDVQVIGIDPKKLDLSSLRKIAQSGIAAAVGIPAVVVGLFIGLETSTAKASYEESLWQAYVACIIPMLKRITRQITNGLVNDPVFPLGDIAKLRAWYDLSEVSCLQEDQNELATRLAMLFEKNVIKRSEARGPLGFQMAEGEEDGYSSDLNQSSEQSDEDDPEDDDTDKDAKDEKRMSLRELRAHAGTHWKHATTATV